MCGFAGVVHWDGAPAAASQLPRMAGLLRHRGPDELCAAAPEPGVGLAHARLRVMDCSDAARQPMASEDGAVWLVYNGEIYNFPALRAELAARGALFRSRSDTEVVLRAYEQWGPDAIQRFDGMFALAVWDGRRRQLVLARDRVGKKPLYYWTDGRCAVFGSTIKALLVHPHVPCAVHDAGLPFLLAFGFPPTGETCYAGIRQVPPASLLRLQAGDAAPAPTTYWDPDLTPRRPAPTARAAADELRRRVTAAVRRRLLADVPLGAFLSGGVDSTIVVGLMTELAGGSAVKTFSIGFEGDARFDETRYAQLVARRFRTQHTTFTVTPQSFDLLEQLVWHHDQPFGDSSAIPTFLLARLTREHVTVALTGDGGDELFAGYRRFAAARWADRLPSPVWGGLARLLGGLPAGAERTVWARLQRFVRVARLPLPERYWQCLAYWRTPILPTGPSTPLSQLHPSLSQWWGRSRGWSPLARLLYLNLKEYLPNDLLAKTDRCSMAHGLEVRSPLLDTALIEYVAALPDSLKLSGGRTKVLLHAACRDLVPAAVRRRGKMGFGVPLGTWFRRQWRGPLQDLLSPATGRLYHYVDAAAVHASIRNHLAGVEDAGHRLWLLLTLEVWLRQLQRPASAPGTEAVRWVTPGPARVGLA